MLVTPFSTVSSGVPIYYCTYEFHVFGAVEFVSACHVVLGSFKVLIAVKASFTVIEPVNSRQSWCHEHVSSITKADGCYIKVACYNTCIIVSAVRLVNIFIICSYIGTKKSFAKYQYRYCSFGSGFSIFIAYNICSSIGYSTRNQSDLPPDVTANDAKCSIVSMSSSVGLPLASFMKPLG